MNTKKEKFIKATLPVVNAGQPDTGYLCYTLDVEDVTLQASLLPAHIIKEIIFIIAIVIISTNITFICQLHFFS